jgi:hypothetical protein
MTRIGADMELWNDMSEASLTLRPRADTENFASGVRHFLVQLGLVS